MNNKRLSPVRLLAVQILDAVIEEDAYVNLALTEAFKNNAQISPAERGAVERLVRGCLQELGMLDAKLKPFLKGDPKKLPSSVRQILRIAAYQLLFDDKVIEALIVNESVVLTQELGVSGLKGLVNAVLRRFAEAAPLYRSQKSESSAENYPEWIVNRWRNQFGDLVAEKLCVACNQTPAICLRVNLSKTSLPELQSSLLQQGWKTKLTPYAMNALTVLDKQSNFLLTDLEAFKKGWFWIQDESSMLVTDLLPETISGRAIDLCSAPGGKTCSLVQRCPQLSEVVALDRNPQRLDLVKDNCQRLDITKVSFLAVDALNYTSNEKFEVVLLDAPCSGLGALAKRADARWRKAESDLPELNQIQQAMLTKAANLVKPHGYLLYSTCSIDRQENEDRVEGFMKSTDMQFEVVTSPILAKLGVDSAHTFMRTLPHLHNTSGAFAALLRLKS